MMRYSGLPFCEPENETDADVALACFGEDNALLKNEIIKLKQEGRTALEIIQTLKQQGHVYFLEEEFWD